MANEVTAAFATAWRDFETDGVPTSGAHKPRKSAIRAIGPLIDSRLAATDAGFRQFETWTLLAASPGTVVGQAGRVTADAGTHTDPVAGGTVANEGNYRWSAAPAGWRRVGDLVDDVAVAALQDDIDTVISDVSALDVALGALLPAVPLAKGGTGQTTALAGKDALAGGAFNISAAATIHLATAVSELSVITGSATITSLGTGALAGVERVVRFFSAGSVLTHGANLILPGKANITVEADDTAVFRCVGGSPNVWLCISYKRASGKSVNESTALAAGRAATKAWVDIAGRSDVPIVVRSPASDSSPVAAATYNVAGYGIGIENVTADDVVSGFAIWTYQSQNVNRWELRVYERDQSGGAITTGPVASDIVTLPEFSTNWVASAGVQLARFEFSAPMRLKAGKKYIFMALGLDGGGAPVISGSLLRSSTSLWAAGWIYHQPSTAINVMAGGTLSPTGYVFRSTKEARVPTGDAKVIGLPVASGLNLDFTGCLLEDQNGVRPLWAGALALTAGATASGVTVNSHPLKSSPSGEPPVWLGYYNITISEVRRSDNNTLLTAGVDYIYEKAGWIYGLHLLSADNYSVNVTLSYDNERIVDLVYNPATLTIDKNEGSDAMLVAHEDQFLPSPSVSGKPLFTALVSGGTVASITPVSTRRGPIPMASSSSELAHFAEWNKWTTRRIRQRLHDKLATNIAFYGDSITAQGGGAVLPAALEPNRVGLDSSSGIFSGAQYGSTPLASWRSDVLAAAKTATLNGQTKYLNNWTWLLCEQVLEDAYGYTLKTGAPAAPSAGEYVGMNFGIGGSTAASTAGNGAHVDRLAALIDPSAYGYSKPDLVFVAFGMNDHLPFTGAKHPQSSFPTNLGAIVDALKAEDIEVMLFAPFLPASNVYSLAVWREICQQVVQVAHAKEVAVHPWHLFDGGENSSYIGVPDSMRCRMNILNHPGFRERKLYARAAAQYLLP